MTYDARFAAYRDAVNEALSGFLDASSAPEPLLSAMRYSLLAGGKRLRAVLLLSACEVCGGDWRAALPYACGLEMIHAYSLIHDDLPAMDDDDLRRGKPTNHKVFGEGIAVLAGDGLLSLAFEVMLGAARSPEQVEAALRIARAAGVSGMVGGQCVDVDCEAKGTGGEAELSYIHLHKTADLFIGAMGAGLALAGATPAQQHAGERFARALGIAFQICDDLLDVEGDAALLGKATGMDAVRGKLTWPGVFGADEAKRALRAETETARAALAPFGDSAAFLLEMAERLLVRNC